jgi:hypothetical protein
MIDFNIQIKFTPIPTNTSIYRGDSNIYNNLEQDILEGKYKYFLNQPDDAVDDQYGIMHEFNTTKNLLLIRLDDKETQTYLYELADENIKNIFKKNFGFENNLRDTDREPDAKMAEFLCNLGYDGYLTDKMKTDGDGTFHREIVICNPIEKLEYVKQITDNARAETLKQEWKLKQMELQDKENRKKKVQRNRFEDDEEDEEETTTKPNFFSNLFGDDDGYETPGGTKHNKKNKKKYSKKKGRYNKRNTKRKYLKKH